MSQPNPHGPIVATFKYQVVRNYNGGESAILFDKEILHSKVYYRNGRDWTILGAGFVDMYADGHVFCYGESETLKKKSRVEDTAIVAKLLGRNHAQAS